MTLALDGCAYCGIRKEEHHVCRWCVCTSCPQECDEYVDPLKKRNRDHCSQRPWRSFREEVEDYVTSEAGQ